MRQFGPIVLDVSTMPYGIDFAVARTNEDRLQHAPPLLTSCVYFVKSRSYRYFGPSEVNLLVNYLKHTEELVTFNGLKFDLLVLRRHYGLKGRVPLKGKHTDLGMIAERRTGRWVKFKEMIALNLGEEKLDIDRLAHDPVNRSDTNAGCRSDVRQTYKLWRLLNERALRFPQ